MDCQGDAKMTVESTNDYVMTDDETREVLNSAMAQLEAATTVDDLKHVLRALIIAQRDSLNPPGYLGI